MFFRASDYFGVSFVTNTIFGNETGNDLVTERWSYFTICIPAHRNLEYIKSEVYQALTGIISTFVSPAISWLYSPLIGAELIEPTIKDMPNSPKQSYTLTGKAMAVFRSASPYS